MTADKITNNLKANQLQVSYTAGANVTIRAFSAYRSGNTVVVEVYFDTSAAISNNGDIIKFSGGLPTPVSRYATGFARGAINNNMAMVCLEAVDTSAIRSWGTTNQDYYYYALLVYVAR